MTLFCHSERSEESDCLMRKPKKALTYVVNQFEMLRQASA